MSWRQHRYELFGMAVVMALLAIVLVPVGLQMRHVFVHTGMASCVPSGFSSPACSDAFSSFERKFSWFTVLLGWLNLVPGILGAAVGAPLVAREMERGTFRLAFTQSVNRTRWVLAKIALLAAGVLVVALIFIALVTWTRVPLDRLGSRLNPNTTFDFEGTVGLGYFLFAFALGTLLGTVLRRVIPALVGTLVIFLPVRLFIQNRRLSFIGPLTRTASPSAFDQQKVGTDYVLDVSLGPDPRRYHTAAQQIHALSQANLACPTQRVACLQVHGIRAIETYVPLRRFWELQLIETTGFVLVASVLLIMTVMIVRRRRS